MTGIYVMFWRNPEISSPYHGESAALFHRATQARKGLHSVPDGGNHALGGSSYMVSWSKLAIYPLVI